jgi:hypothetical protein
MLAPGYKDRCARRTGLHAAALQQPTNGCHPQPTQPTSMKPHQFFKSQSQETANKVHMAAPMQETPVLLSTHALYACTHTHAQLSLPKLTHFLICPRHTQALMHTPISGTPVSCLLQMITADATKQQVPVTQARVQTDKAMPCKQRLAQPKRMSAHSHPTQHQGCAHSHSLLVCHGKIVRCQPCNDQVRIKQSCPQHSLRDPTACCIHTPSFRWHTPRHLSPMHVQHSAPVQNDNDDSKHKKHAHDILAGTQNAFKETHCGSQGHNALSTDTIRAMHACESISRLACAWVRMLPGNAQPADSSTASTNPKALAVSASTAAAHAEGTRPTPPNPTRQPQTPSNTGRTNYSAN